MEVILQFLSLRHRLYYIPPRDGWVGLGFVINVLYTGYRGRLRYCNIATNIEIMLVHIIQYLLITLFEHFILTWYEHSKMV